MPENVIERADGWRGFRIKGTLEFTLIGLLSGILESLANNEISVFVVSTFNTDYVFVKEGNFHKAVAVLKESYSVSEV